MRLRCRLGLHRFMPWESPLVIRDLWKKTERKSVHRLCRDCGQGDVKVLYLKPLNTADTQQGPHA